MDPSELELPDLAELEQTAFHCLVGYSDNPEVRERYAELEYLKEVIETWTTVNTNPDHKARFIRS